MKLLRWLFGCILLLLLFSVEQTESRFPKNKKGTSKNRSNNNHRINEQLNEYQFGLRLESDLMHARHQATKHSSVPNKNFLRKIPNQKDIRRQNLKNKNTEPILRSNEEDDSEVVVLPTITITMNSNGTERFFLDTDSFFPYDNFTVSNVIPYFKSTHSLCLSSDSGNGCSTASVSPDPTGVSFQIVPPIETEDEIEIQNHSIQMKQQSPNESANEDYIQCPEEGITIVASKAPEDQPAHIFLSDKNELFVIIFNDETAPLKKKKILYKDISSVVDATIETLHCMDIEVFDSQESLASKRRSRGYAQRSGNSSSNDLDNCFVFIDCKVKKIDGSRAENPFAMVFVPLAKDDVDIIDEIGEASIVRYTLEDEGAIEYFYTCDSRCVANYNTILVMFCPSKPETQLVFLPNIDKGTEFPKADETILVSQEDLRDSNCEKQGKQVIVNALLTNSLYEEDEFNEMWQFALLLDNRICKCRLADDLTNLPDGESKVKCLSISLSDEGGYYRMTSIENEGQLTLFVGGDASIDEIQVGEGMTEGQNLIVDSLDIQEDTIEADLVNIIVNQDFVIALMLRVSAENNNNDTDSEVESSQVLKIFSRSQDNPYLHYYKEVKSGVAYWQNDNFFDMGNYFMVYYKNLCKLEVNFVTQKPLIITTEIETDKQLTPNITSITVIPFMINGTYFEMATTQEPAKVNRVMRQLNVRIVPFSKQVLSTDPSQEQDQIWQQQMVSLNIRKGVTGSLLNFIYEPRVQDDQIQSLIDYNQTIQITDKFFQNRKIFFVQLNDTKQMHNPEYFRVVVSSSVSKCIIEAYTCRIVSFLNLYETDSSACILNLSFNLSTIAGSRVSSCDLDTYQEGAESVFIADKKNLIAAVCNRLPLDSIIDVDCEQITGSFLNWKGVLNNANSGTSGTPPDDPSDNTSDPPTAQENRETATLNSYAMVYYLETVGYPPMLVTVTSDSKQLILFFLEQYYTIESRGYDSQIFLVVDSEKIESLLLFKIKQCDTYFLQYDTLFLLTTDYKVYVLTRIQQIYRYSIPNQYDTPNEAASATTTVPPIPSASSSGNSEEQRDNTGQSGIPPIQKINFDKSKKLVHVSAMIHLPRCEGSTQMQIFTLFGVDTSTISLIVLCYNGGHQLMEEYEFQNAFKYNRVREFPFFDYVLSESAPHFTDRMLIYLSTSVETRLGIMTSYLLYSIYDYTPNSAVFEVITCYPTSEVVLPSLKTACGAKPPAKNNPLPTYVDQLGIYDAAAIAKFAVVGVPFDNNYQGKSISFAMFFGIDTQHINYINFSPQMYANANITSNVTEELDINLIISKLNMRDIHFCQYTVTFNLSDSQIQLAKEPTSIQLSPLQTQQWSNAFSVNYTIPLDTITGPIESYSLWVFSKGNGSEEQFVDSSLASTKMTSTATTKDAMVFMVDYLELQKYFYTYTETFFKYGQVNDILTFASLRFTLPAYTNGCPDCVNLIAVISSKYIMLIEVNSYQKTVGGGTINPVTKPIFEIATDPDMHLKPDDGTCSLTMSSNSHLLVYCVSKTNSTIFRLYQVIYEQMKGIVDMVQIEFTQTSGYIGYVDEIIPFEIAGKVFLMIKTHLIMNQETSLFKMAKIECEDSVCTLHVVQNYMFMFPNQSSQFIVDFDGQVLKNSDEEKVVLNKNGERYEELLLGLFISPSLLGLALFKYTEPQEVVGNSGDEELLGEFEVVEHMNWSLNNITMAVQGDGSELTFVKILNVVSLNSFTMLLGTQTNYYEILVSNSQDLTLLYTYGKYYQCDHPQAVKPLIFTSSGAPLERMMVRSVPFEGAENTRAVAESNVQSVLASCERFPQTKRPTFDPETIFEEELTNMFFVQYFTKSTKEEVKNSWPVRILTMPFSSSLPMYVFDGFQNNAGESRIVLSNFSYFLVEFEVFATLSLNLTVVSNSTNEAPDYGSNNGDVNLLQVRAQNSFSEATLDIRLAFEGQNANANSPSKSNRTWFIVLIVVISILSLVALVFIVLWIRKQRVTSNTEKRKKTNRYVTTGLSDSDEEDEDDGLDDDDEDEDRAGGTSTQRPSKRLQTRTFSVNQVQQLALEEIFKEAAANSNMPQTNLNGGGNYAGVGGPLDTMNPRRQSDRLTFRLSSKVDNLLRSVSIMRDRRMPPRQQQQHLQPPDVFEENFE